MAWRRSLRADRARCAWKVSPRPGPLLAAVSPSQVFPLQRLLSTNAPDNAGRAISARATKQGWQEQLSEDGYPQITQITQIALLIVRWLTRISSWAFARLLCLKSASRHCPVSSFP